MADPWLEEEEEELRGEIRDSGNRRGRARQQATDHSERNKPEHRSSSQGPLSSIRAAIKRTSTRSSSQSEQQRGRRRPEITIVAAEPLRPTSWFPGSSGNCAASCAAGYPLPPPPPPQGLWRISETGIAELPPSYDQVLKEINQSQVSTPASNTTPRCSTTTIATQTDFVETAEDTESDVNCHFGPCQTDTSVERQSEPPLAVSSVPTKESNYPLISFDTDPSDGQSTQEDTTAIKRPVPRPRSKLFLKPLVGVIVCQIQEDQIGTDSTVVGELSQTSSENCLEDPFAMGSMSAESSQSSILSRIKAFEAQSNAETAATGFSKKPEILPRSVASKPAVASEKPALAPKPSAASKTPNEWDTPAETKPKPVAREVPPLLPKTSAAGATVGTKPEPARKPKPSFSSDALGLNQGANSSRGNLNGELKFPIPAPRPTLPKKNVPVESGEAPTIAPKPVVPAPRLSVATRAKAFKVLDEGAATSPPASFVQATSGGEFDLIKFDEDLLPAEPLSNNVDTLASSTKADHVPVFPKTEPTSFELPSRPPVTRKPTVIRIPSKPSKALSEDAQAPPPLPIENPVGVIPGIATKKPSIAARTSNLESERCEWAGSSFVQPALPPRPLGGKVLPSRPPPPKGAPARPPPPKLSGFQPSLQYGILHHASSETGLDVKHNVSGIKRSKSLVFKSQEFDLPPRPGPGHPLYNKYMMAVPHGIAERDYVTRLPGELSFQRGDVLVLAHQIDNNCFQCQKGDESGKVSMSNLKVIIPLDEENTLGRGQPASCAVKGSDSSSPHALVLHDFQAEQADDLSLKSGETVYLLERLDQEWYRGTCRGRTGVFPANFVKVIIDVAEGNSTKKSGSPSPNISGPRCRARFDFESDQADELSFSEGDIIKLKEYLNEEWAEGEMNGRTGIFPINFVEVIEDLPPFNQNKSVASDSGTSFKSKPDSSECSQAENSSGQWCEALYDFTAETAEDLSFQQGDRILITEQLDSEWCKGKINGREGIFPSAFVHFCSGPVVDKKPQAMGSRKGKAKALFDFSGDNEDELSFKAGDMIVMVESVDAEWMSGELHGKSGIFPRNYVHVLQEPC
ncbi:SH3 domain-containing protein 19 isoform X2 [Latimeria chalumnae]|uniref:SH3 domain-containing protein 19 isoform X2 n=1 Tax=Latimeria chalumnae TaxID=7897 RepID=UPI0003C191DC|nr:PREDICTED: SH3 domain-containing protein 19 isoform X2 [Latimeria chalumnae]|eukprot:XP_005996408.1 PREDICTED: SH3 domain-containing protein 19 isoform X2 [Latimeria chalumnae]